LYQSQGAGARIFSMKLGRPCSRCKSVNNEGQIFYQGQRGILRWGDRIRELESGEMARKGKELFYCSECVRELGTGEMIMGLVPGERIFFPLGK